MMNHVLQLLPNPTKPDFVKAISIVDNYLRGLTPGMLQIHPSDATPAEAEELEEEEVLKEAKAALEEAESLEEVPDSVMEEVDGGKFTKPRRNKRSTKKRNKRSTKKRNKRSGAAISVGRRRR